MYMYIADGVLNNLGAHTKNTQKSLKKHCLGQQLLKGGFLWHLGTKRIKPPKTRSLPNPNILSQ